MAQQLSFEDIGGRQKRHVTAREKFLDKMDELIPWDELVSAVAPFYYKNGSSRRHFSAETLLRMYFIREWYSLTDKAAQDAVYDSFAFRKFLHLDTIGERIPDASTLTAFRKLLTRHRLVKTLNDAVTAAVSAKKMKRVKIRVTENTLRNIPGKRKK